MVERIRALAKESGLIQYDTDGKIQDVEKFAELIVRECADIASINQHQYNSVGEYVLKHFGVKE